MSEKVASPPSTREQIAKFLEEKRLAIVGVSRKDSDFTRALFAEFLSRGYEALPVNPAVEEIVGVRCYAHVQDIRPRVKTVLIMTPPEVTEQVVRECAEAGVSQVWMHRGVGSGAVSEAAIAFCEEHGISVIPGYCPFMFFNHAGFFHEAHGFLMKLTRSYPN